jgi:Flp pilus assembly protein TadG
MKKLTSHRRPASVSALTALLLVPILAIAAFAIDTGWIVLTQTDLQNAADAAALAGAGQLMDGYVQYNLPTQTQQATILATAVTNASTYAKNFASYNSAGGVSSLVLNDADIEFGFTDGSGNYTAGSSGYPNTIKVTMRRDNQANGALSLFFAPLIGTRTASLTATASATIYAGVADSFQNAGTMLKILPMTLDVNNWNNYIATGLSPDGQIDSGPNGAPQIQVYPSIKFTGNFGLLSLDQGNDGSSTISGWINNGTPWSDLQNEVNANLIPLSKHDPTKWDWEGNPGLKTSDIHALQSHIGEQYLLPLFKPLDPGSPDPNTYAAGSGNGGNYYYNIVQFVGITITAVDNKSVHIQPSAFISPDLVFNPTPAPAGTSSTVITTLATPKLTR